MGDARPRSGGRVGGIVGLWHFLHRWWALLEADFQRFYSIDLADVWTDDLPPRRFKNLFRGLMRNPESVTRQQARIDFDPTGNDAPAPAKKAPSKVADVKGFLPVTYTPGGG